MGTALLSENALPPTKGLLEGPTIMDMTAMGRDSEPRYTIAVSASDVIIADNQIFVRARQSDPAVAGIRLGKPAVNIDVHGNQISLCGTGIEAHRYFGRLGEVIGDTTFIETGQGIPFERRRSHRYRGWGVAWIEGQRVAGTSAIAAFDPETLQFHLTESRELKPGQVFEVFPPGGANWLIRDNTVTGCVRPVVLDSYGSATSVLRGKPLSGVKSSIEVSFRLRRDCTKCGERHLAG